MARLRSSKRNSSSRSYTSTLTTIAFIALCAIGVWMLASNPQVTPQTTTHVTKPVITTTTDIAADADVSISNEVEHAESRSKKDTHVYEDNPGDLPDDAIKSDELKSNDDSDNKEESNYGKQETDGGDSKADQEGSSQDLKGEGSGEEQQKQEERQNHISEESSYTQNRQAGQTSHESSQSEGSQEASVNQEQETNASQEEKTNDNQEQEQRTVSETDDSNSHDSINQNEEQDQAQEQQQQQQKQEDVEKSGKDLQDSQNQESKEDQQQGSGLDENNQESDHNEKTYEEQQQEQRIEDTGGQNSSQESQKEVSEEDQKQRTQQQQQQKQDVEENSKDLQNSQNQESKEDEQQQGSGLNENNQESNQNEKPFEDQHQQDSSVHNVNNQESDQNEKTYDEQQQEQRQEDTGVQDSSQESQNEVSEEDQKQRIQQQQQQTHDQETEQESQVDSNTNQETKQESSSGESAFPGGLNPGIPKESKESWSTQAAESENQKERRKEESDGNDSMYGYTWQLCNVTAGPDYIPCLDNEKALRQLHTTGHFEHRERHCPELGPTCLVPLPQGYKRPITWPQSRDKIWYHNVPHPKLAEVKGHQNWVKVTGEFLTFPGGGTQFIHGALHYIDFVQQAVPKIKWGKHTRVILDVGCGVASFGGYIFERDVLTISFAPKDEHEAQVQFALERGIPAISAVMGSQRLPFPSRVFDLIHCARCRVPWHAEGACSGGKLLLELNRLLRPGGYFVWSATPVYQKLQEDVEIWQAMSALTVSMCWELVTIKKDKLNGIGAAIYRKPTTNNCYDQRIKNSPPMCDNDDDANAAWYVPLQACMHRVPRSKSQRGGKWPEDWPERLQIPPYWLKSSQKGIYGKPAPQDFEADYEHWKHVVGNSYMKGLGISWSNVRNVMDMRAVYGGCQLAPVLAEVDRIARPGGKLIVRDESSAIEEVENLLKSLHWEVHLIFSKDQEGLLIAQKDEWRPQTRAAFS
ncbi:hypothetical protein POTOM_027915 [Populus tomentosa]|uniref:DUF248-1 n=1 Tax=Populus tomentosa TaxID=118781 RepID=A0A8X7ZI44_POPTO|nr:hypothetical protein POTOM_027915 [Populus tomentosa]